MKRQSKRSVDQVTLVREVIAAGAVTRVDRCPCGDLYLTVGPITMGLHPEVLAELSATLGRAMAMLGCRSRVAGAGPDEASAGRTVGEPTEERESNGSGPDQAPGTTEVN
jgi:hypothetical protein